MQPLQRRLELSGRRDRTRATQRRHRQSATPYARPPRQQEGHVQQMVKEEAPPLATAFLDLLSQSAFTLVRQQGQASHIAQITLQDCRFSIVSMNSSFPIGLYGLRGIRRYM